MGNRVGTLSPPPEKWARLLSEFCHHLYRVHVQWRRGQVPYRPIVPEEIEIEELNEADWQKFEREDTNFEWELRDETVPSKRVERIDEIVNHLWAVARRWVHVRKAWCDFKLVGFDENGEELFSDGRRCRFEYPEDEPEHWSGRDAQSAPARAEIDERAAYKAHTKGLEELLDHNRREREEAAERSRSLLNETHLMWHQLADATRQAHDYQLEQISRARELRSGALELKARAFGEMQKTAQVEMMVKGVQNGLDAIIGNVIPFGDRLIEVFKGHGHIPPDVFPRFKCAQQAMSYLAITLSPTQLKMLCKDKDAATGVVVRLEDASKMELEAEAVEHVSSLVMILRSPKFRDVADAEQQLAARYIISRLALYRIGTHDEATT